jgi:hypothetical protein
VCASEKPSPDVTEHRIHSDCFTEKDGAKQPQRLKVLNSYRWPSGAGGGIIQRAMQSSDTMLSRETKIALFSVFLVSLFFAVSYKTREELYFSFQMKRKSVASNDFT